MKLFLLSLILAGLVAFAACKQEVPSNPEPTSRSQPTGVLKTPPESVAKIVAFGDSLTAGLGIGAAESYPALLQKRLEADGYKYEVVNAGVSGDTSAGGLRRIDWAMEGDVRFVILELGANDILRGQPIDQMKKNLGEIISRVQSRGARVLLAGMQAPTNSGPEYRKQVQEAFQDLAREKNVVLIPFFLDRVAGIDSLNQSDGIHPNAEGTKIIADTVYKALRPMLDKDEQ